MYFLEKCYYKWYKDCCFSHREGKTEEKEIQTQKLCYTDGYRDELGSNCLKKN